MTFILRIFFTGLIAFVPSRDGKELTVLLVDARTATVASDNSPIPIHHPILVARAARCQGHCQTGEDAEIARLLFPQDGANDVKYLAAALGQGAAWKLDGSDLSIVDAGRPSATLPSLAMWRAAPGTKNREQKDFQWIAELGRVVPSAGVVDPDALARLPQRGRIVARLRLRAGRVWPYRLVRTADKQKVQVFDFKTLHGDGGRISDPQALADWVVAEVEVSDDSVEIVESHFADREIRTMRLAPENGLVELAVMNITDPPPQEPGESHQEHTIDTHFERFYDLALTPPAPDQRPVPHATAGPAVVPAWEELPSRLLAGLMLDNPPRGFYERIMCPMAQLSAGDAP